MPTIRDIARISGVSKSTVARALNNDGYVKKETRINIANAVKELNYTPNYVARGMRTNRTSAIGIFIPDYANPFYAELFKGIEAVTRKAGYMNLVCHTDEDAEVELYYIKELLKRQIDGIIFCTYNRSPEGQAYLQEVAKKIPMVFMDPVFNDLGFSCVAGDGYSGTKLAVAHLCRSGSKRIAYIKGPGIHVVTADRYQGYRDALGECKCICNDDLVYESVDFQMESGAAAAMYFMSLREPPDAIMAATDILAIGALKYLHKIKIAVPKEVRIIGFDNIPLSTLVEPSLTTVAQPIFEMGEKAAELLMQHIQTPETPRQQIIMPCTLVERESA